MSNEKSGRRQFALIPPHASNVARLCVAALTALTSSPICYAQATVQGLGRHASSIGYDISDDGTVARSAPYAVGQTCDGLVAEWRFNDQTLSDSSGNNHHGVNFDGTFAPAVIQTGYQLSGSGQYGDFGNPSLLNPDTAMTVMAWYRPVSFGGTGNDPIVDKGFTSHTPPYYQYHLGVGGNQ